MTSLTTAGDVSPRRVLFSDIHIIGMHAVITILQDPKSYLRPGQLRDQVQLLYEAYWDTTSHDPGSGYRTP